MEDSERAGRDGMARRLVVLPSEGEAEARKTFLSRRQPPCSV